MERLLQAASLLLAVSLLTPSTGFSSERFDFTTGIGFSALYIEEIIIDDQLSSGASAIPLHLSSTAKFKLGTDYAISLTSQIDVYKNDQAAMVQSGSLALGPNIQFGRSNFTLAGGWAYKQRQSSPLVSGYSLLIHSQHPITQRIILEAGFSYSLLENNLDKTADLESISSTYIAVGYQWF